MSTKTKKEDDYSEWMRNQFQNIELFKPFESIIETLQTLFDSFTKDPLAEMKLNDDFFRKKLREDPGDLLKYATKDDSQSKIARGILTTLMLFFPSPIPAKLAAFSTRKYMNKLEGEGDAEQIDLWGEVLGNKIEPLHHLNILYQAAFKKYEEDASLNIDPGEPEYEKILEQVKSYMGGQGNWEKMAESVINLINQTKWYEESWKEAISQYQNKFGAKISEIQQLEYSFDDIEKSTKIIEQYGSEFFTNRYGSLFELFKDPNLDRIQEELKRAIMVQLGQQFENPNVQIDFQGLVQQYQSYDTNQESKLGISASAGAEGKKSSVTLPIQFNPPLNFVIDVAGMPSYVDTGLDVATDFLLPGERGHILTEEEIERLKKLQQFPILPSESSDVTSKIVSNIEEMNRNAFIFSDTLSDVAHIAGQLGGAFMNVDESIGKAIGLAEGLASGK